jgi:hypothetical protein
MKLLLVLSFGFLSNCLSAQNKEDSLNHKYPYQFRIYDTRPCGGCPERNNPNYQPEMFINPYEGFTNKPINLDSLPDSTKTMLLKMLNKQPKSILKDKPVS